MKISFYLSTKEKGNAIYIAITMRPKERIRMKFPHFSAKSEDWDTGKGRFLTGRGKSLNAQNQSRLDLCKVEVNAFIMEYIRAHKQYPNKKELEHFLLVGNSSVVLPNVKTMHESVNDISLLPQISSLISEFEKGETLTNGKKMTKATMDGYKQIYKVLVCFQQERNTILSAHSVVEESTIRQIESYLTINRNLKLNTVGKRLRNLKTILGHLTRRGIINKEPFRTYGIKTPKEEVVNIALTETELIALENLDLSQNRSLEVACDHFICMCYVGLRYSEYRKFVKSRTWNKVVKVFSDKTGVESIVPLFPPVKRIIKKYGGILPDLISSQKMGDYIKEICAMIPSLHEEETKVYTKGGVRITEKVPRYKMASNHTSRRTFITLMRRWNIPEEDIRAVSGHKDSRSFRVYDKMDKAEVVSGLEERLADRFKSGKP